MGEEVVPRGQAMARLQVVGLVTFEDGEFYLNSVSLGDYTSAVRSPRLAMAVAGRLYSLTTLNSAQNGYAVVAQAREDGPAVDRYRVSTLELAIILAGAEALWREHDRQERNREVHRE